MNAGMEFIIVMALGFQILNFVALYFLRELLLEIRYPVEKPVTVATPFIVPTDRDHTNAPVEIVEPDTIGKYNPGTWT